MTSPAQSPQEYLQTLSPEEVAELLHYLTPEERAQFDGLLSEVRPLDTLPLLPHDPTLFMQSFFYVYDTKNLLRLFPAQLNPLRHALSKYEDGRFRYDTVLWSWIKKSAKSTIVAAVCDYVACHKEGASIKLIGNDLKQADSRVGFYLRESIKLGASMGYTGAGAEQMQEFRANTIIKPSGYQILYPNGSRIEMIPVDPRGEAGANDDMSVFSELWGWKHKSHQDMWAEMTISPNRFGFAQRWVDSYAGFEGESPILEGLYEEVVKKGKLLNIPDNPECYENQGGNIFATWVTKHHLPWQSEAYYASERANLLPNQFKRLHLNEWVGSEEAFIEMEWWDTLCVDSELPPSSKYEPIILALDAGIHSDTFAIVAVARHKAYESRYKGKDVSAPDILIRRHAMAFTPPQGGKLKFFSDDPNEVTPESEIKRIIRERNVIQVCYDPWQLEHFVDQLEAETGAWFEPYGQSSERELGDKMLYDMIREGRIKHSGHPQDPLRTHLANANAKVLGDDKRLRIVKREDSRKIDLAVALAMACKRAADELPK